MILNKLQQEKYTKMMRRIPKNSYLPTVAAAVAILFLNVFSTTINVAETYKFEDGKIIVELSGSGNFTIPAGVTEVTVEAWGAGGGGSRRNGGTSNAAGGGGGGAYAKSTFNVTAGAKYSYTVGTGGGSNTSGGYSEFKFDNEIKVKAAGGTGGDTNKESGSEGGSATNSVGNISTSAGNNGGDKYSSRWSTFSGAGGAAARTDIGGGGGGSSVSGNTVGMSGVSPGGGGSGGAVSVNWNDNAGGKGGDGLIRISYTPSYEHFYSYKSGAWNETTTWTHDPSGTLQVGSEVPGNGAYIYILSGREVSLNSDVSISSSSLEIKNGGILNLGNYKFNNAFLDFNGQGTLRLASVNFPTATVNNFVKNGGGTTEYTNSSDFTLPNSQTEYNNLVIASPAIATQLHNLTINGNLHVETGTYKISDDATNNTTARYELTIEGDVLVDNGASLTVGTRRTTTTGTPGNITGGNASPFIGYYYNHSHTVIIKGGLTNNGTVRFTNMPYPIFNSFPTANGQTGMATVYFQGTTDNMLTCNGTTDFYNLVLDKGNDQTYKLTVYSSHYYNFRLFGAISEGGYNDGRDPELRKALWIRSGTLELTGQVVIPALTEGRNVNNTPNSDFFLPAKAALVLNGPDVIVIATADDYREVNAAYGVDGGTGNVNGVNIAQHPSSFSVYGKFQVKDGYFSTRESGGIIFWDLASGEVEINGGYVDVKQLRAAGSNAGLASYTQTGGTLALRGRFQRTVTYGSPQELRAMGRSTTNTTRLSNGLDSGVGTFNLNSENNVINMSGGTVEIYDAMTSGGAVQIKSLENNINISGGTFEFKPISENTEFRIRSTAPFGNFIVNREGGNSNVVIRDNPLVVLKDIKVQSGLLNANNLDVTIGGDLTINSGATYTPGSNITTFNGGTHQTINNNGTITSGFNNLIVDKKGGELRLAGASSYTVRGGFELLQGTIHDKGRTLNVVGNIINSGIHKGDAGGGITLNGGSAQTVGGSGKGVFNNLTLNNNSSGSTPISLTSDMAINGVLTFSRNKGLNIGEHNLKLGAAASFGSNTGSGYRYIRTGGKVGDGGLTITYDDKTEKTFPIGVNAYTPAEIGFSSAPNSYGSITVVPVANKHPLISGSTAIDYYWRVRSEGITGYEGKVTHKFVYTSSEGGNTSGYKPAMFENATNNWHFGENDISNRTITGWNGSENLLNGDYTVGSASSFVEPTIYYSRQNGNWSTRTTWSKTGHSGVASTDTPSASDVVIINHNVELTGNANSGSLMVAENGVLDVKTHSGSNFSTVFTHPSGKNGTIRVGVANSNNSIFNIPIGDFSEFYNNLGTIEFYSSYNGSRTYRLPSTVNKYGNLKISSSNNATIRLETDLLVLGDIIVSGATSSSYFNLGNSGTRTIKVQGNIEVQSGQMRFAGGTQNVLVEKDVIVSNNSAINRTAGSNHTFEIKGSLINNGTANFTNIPVTFSGSTNASVSGSSGGITFSRLTVNKGSSQTPKLTIDYSGTLTTDANNWLFLQNGTLVYKRNSGSNFTISTTSSFTIPATAGLWVESSGSGKVVIADASRNDNDLFLNGKLTVVSGSVEIGNTGNYNQDIEYSGGGSSSIEVRGGSLTVNGQIRRNPATTSGVLSYVQSGGNVTINGRNSNTTNAKLEVLNAGSKFNMSGGTLTIARGGGVSVGDLYIRPASSTVTGGTIVLNSGSNYIIDSDVALYNMEVNGNVKVMTSALTLKGYLTISLGSTLDMNELFDIPLTVGGHFTNNGAYNHYKNLTTFNGGTHELLGATQTSFYDLKINPTVSFTVKQDVFVGQDLEIAGGRFLLGDKTITVSRHIKNTGIYESNVDAGGILLTNGTVQHQISGNGTFGRLELNNILGARTMSEINLQGNLVLTNGVLNINKYLLTLGENAEIQSVQFNHERMISSDGVYSNTGVRKYFPQSNFVTAREFIYPMGVGTKYTPIKFFVKSSSSGGYVRINTINEKHPSTLSPYQVLSYYWDVESTGVKGFEGELEFNYHDDDVKLVAGDDATYVAARLLSPGTSWEKASEGAGTDNVVEDNNLIHFTFNGVDNISGEYTAGLDAHIPKEVPTYISNKSGDWSDRTIWTPIGESPECPTGGPNGVVVIIDEGHDVTLDRSYIFAYKTTISGKLKVDKNHIGHNLGAINGEGTLYIEESVLPAGRYSTFFDPKGNSTLEFGGSEDYLIRTDLFTELPNMIISGSGGSRMLPAEPFTVHKSLVINGGILNNSLNNNKLIVNGTMERNGGTFNAGTGANATVVFNGKEMQEVGNFIETSAFNNLEINNSAGLTLTNHVVVKNQLKLTKGVIHTSDIAILKITNSSQTNVVLPTTLSVNSYVDGPMVKKINSGDEFIFPVGKNGVLGNLLKVSATNATEDWTVEYFNPNDTYNQFDDPLTYVNSKDRWSVKSASNINAKVTVSWNQSSDVTPLITNNNTANLQLAEYGGVKWKRIISTASGSNNSGNIVSNNQLAFSTTAKNITSATIESIIAKAKFEPDTAMCGDDVGIPVAFTSSGTISFPYILTYTIDDRDEKEVTIDKLPYRLPTTMAGEYKLVGFTHSSGIQGVVDDTGVTIYKLPTVAEADNVTADCGATSVQLSANQANVGAGLWSVVQGDGGSFEDPTIRNTTFRGTNGSVYTLRWTITNGVCESSSDVVVALPLAAEQPGDFIAYASDVCGGSEVIFTVPLDPAVSYLWSYSGVGSTITGSGNSVRVNFENQAESGTISVRAKNDCNTSAAREMAITVNPIYGVNLTADFIGDVCANSLIVFTATPVDGVWTNYNFLVDESSVKNSGDNSFESSGLVGGNKIKVVATTNKGCNVSSNEVEVVISSVSGVWTGAINSEWNNSGNWCNNQVPDENTAIVINGGTNDLEITGDHVFGALTVNSGAKATLKSGATLDINGLLDIKAGGKFILENNYNVNGLASLRTFGNVSGDATVNLTLPTNEWYYLASPMSAPKTSQFGVGNVDGTYAYTYSTAKTWVQKDTDEVISNGEGMSVYYLEKDNSEVTLDYTGHLNTGTVSTEYKSKNFYLFGNPFPVSLNWQDESWERNKIAGTIWYRTRIDSEMGFVTYNRYGDEGTRVALYPEKPYNGDYTEAELGLIPPYQSVWIYTRTATSSTPASITITDAQKVHRAEKLSGATLKSSSSGKKADIIRIVAKNDRSRDGAVIYFSEGSTDDLDQGDSEKYFNSSTAIPEVYTRIGKTAVAINGLEPFEGSREIPLSVRNRVEGEVELRFDLSLYRSDDVIVLQDLYLDEKINLRARSTYKYEPMNLGDDHLRFSILINPEDYDGGDDVITNIESSVNSGISIQQIDDKALITVSQELLNANKGNIFIYDIEGRRIADYVSTSEKQYIDLPEARGVYVITVIVGDKQEREKIVVK